MNNLKHIIKESFKNEIPDNKPYSVDPSLFIYIRQLYINQRREVIKLSTTITDIIVALSSDPKKDSVGVALNRDIKKKLSRLDDAVLDYSISMSDRVSKLSMDIGGSESRKATVFYFLKKVYKYDFEEFKNKFDEYVKEYDLNKFLPLNEIADINNNDFLSDKNRKSMAKLIYPKYNDLLKKTTALYHEVGYMQQVLVHKVEGHYDLDILSNLMSKISFLKAQTLRNFECILKEKDTPTLNIFKKYVYYFLKGDGVVKFNELKNEYDEHLLKYDVNNE